MANKYKHFSHAAQRERRKWQACLRKRAYDTEENAHQSGQVHYRCSYCGKWHRSGQLTTLIATIRRALTSGRKWT